MSDFNLNRQFEQLELFFEEARQSRQERKERVDTPAFVPPPARVREIVELVPWPPHMRFDR